MPTIKNFMIRLFYANTPTMTLLNVPYDSYQYILTVILVIYKENREEKVQLSKNRPLWHGPSLGAVSGCQGLKTSLIAYFTWYASTIPLLNVPNDLLKDILAVVLVTYKENRVEKVKISKNRPSGAVSRCQVVKNLIIYQFYVKYSHYDLTERTL